MKLPQLHLRDLFWLMALVAMGCGWWLEFQREKLDRDNLLKLWAFDIASNILKREVGATLTVDEYGITVIQKTGRRTVYNFPFDD